MTTPVISLSSTRSRGEIISDVRDACERFGLFQVTSHGVPQELIARVLAQAEHFFSLPLAEKEALGKPSKLEGGYEPVRTWEDNVKELHEGFSIAPSNKLSLARLPSEDRCPEFRNTLVEYYDALQKLSREIFSIVAEGLNVDSHFFDTFCSEHMAWVRMIHYPPVSEEESTAGRIAKGAGEHIDLGAITILLQDAVGGLEIKDTETGAWLPVIPVAGAFTVNLGHLMGRWTNDRYKAVLHRVVPPPANTHRYSVPYFNSGKSDYEIKTIIQDGEVPKYEMITAGEYFECMWRHHCSVAS